MTAEEQSPSILPHGYYTLARNPAYRALLGSEVLLSAGESLHMTILPWLMLEVAGSKSAVGWLATVIYLPYLLFAIPIGALVDRVDLRCSMIIVNLLRALLASAVPILYAAGVLTAWHMLLGVFLLSTFGLVLYLGRSALLPQIVSKEELMAANSASVVLVGLAMIAGTALVGPVVQVLGLVNALVVYIGTLILSATILSALEMPPQATLKEEVNHLVWGDLLEGISYVWREPAIRGIFLLDALYFILADSLVMAGVPLFVKETLHAGPKVYSYIRIAGNVGMLLGALWLGRFGYSLYKGQVIVLGWFGYGLSLLSYPLFRALAPALAASFCASLIGNLIPTCGVSLLQERVPPKLLGRVVGLWTVLAPGTGAFSGVIGGALARVLPATGLLTLAAIISCINALLGYVSGLWHQR